MARMKFDPSSAVQTGMYKVFFKWGHFVGRRPLLVILVSFALALLGSVRLIISPRFPMPAVVEQDELWVPQEAQAIDDKDRYDAVFSTTYRRNTLYFTTKPPGGNILTSPVLAEIRRFDLMVGDGLNATHYGRNRDGSGIPLDFYVEDDGRHSVAGYEEVCAKMGINFGQNLSDPDDSGAPGCLIFGHPLEAFYRVGGGVPRAPTWLPGDFVFDFTDDEINQIVTDKRGPDKTLFPDSSNRTVNVDAIFGGIEKDANGKVTGAKSLAFTCAAARPRRRRPRPRRRRPCPRSPLPPPHPPDPPPQRRRYLLDEMPTDSNERTAAMAWEDQLNYLIHPKWCNDPPDSGGSATEGHIVWESELVDIFPQTAGATSRELSKNIRGDLGALQARRRRPPAR